MFCTVTEIQGQGELAESGSGAVGFSLMSQSEGAAGRAVRGPSSNTVSP